MFRLPQLQRSDMFIEKRGKGFKLRRSDIMRGEQETASNCKSHFYGTPRHMSSPN